MARTRRRFTLAVALALATSATPAAEDVCGPVPPRTLVLALDGVPFRVVEQARSQGAFADWAPTVRLISPFPSVTNVSFTLILDAFGVEPAGGYEFQHFDYDRNRLSSVNLFKYRENSFAWRDLFDSVSRTVGSKIAVYTIPVRKSHKELDSAERMVFESAHEVILAHVGSTDALQHLSGDRETVEIVTQLDGWISELRRRHEQETGRTLRVVLLSDHGNTAGKVHGIDGVRKRLRRAGLDVVEHLRDDNDVVAPTFGLVSYGALFLRPENAGRAAAAIADHPAIEIVAWLGGPDEVRIRSAGGSATVRWRGEGAARAYAYAAESGDPLDLARARAHLAAEGKLGADGFARDADWFEHSALGTYPDAMHRLVASLTGDHILNRASVIFSIRDGYTWGMTTAHWGAWLRGGKIEGTHGSLGEASSVGFLLTTEPGPAPSGSLRAEQALARLADERTREAACGRGGGSIVAVEWDLATAAFSAD